jgi:pyrroloquinoline quinone (PQQ) biosynthesis protein C
MASVFDIRLYDNNDHEMKQMIKDGKEMHAVKGYLIEFYIYYHATKKEQK